MHDKLLFGWTLVFHDFSLLNVDCFSIGSLKHYPCIFFFMSFLYTYIEEEEHTVQLYRIFGGPGVLDS